MIKLVLLRIFYGIKRFTKRICSYLIVAKQLKYCDFYIAYY